MLKISFFVLLMAIVQGVAEFLPISSSGHLLLLADLFDLPEPLTLSIMLHAGTLLSVLVYFSKDIWEAIFRKPRVMGLVVVGSIPTAIIGLTVMKFIPWIEESLLVAGLCFIATGVLLLTVLRPRCAATESERYYARIEREAKDDAPELERGGEEFKTDETTSWLDAFLVGVSQGLAVLPGLSRSGSTISAGVGLNFDREWAAKFSFLLSIPVIGGGALLEFYKYFREAEGDTFADKFLSDPFFVVYVGGAVASFLVGWLSLAFLMRMLREGKLHYFAWWLFLIGPVAIVCWFLQNGDALEAIRNAFAAL